MAARSILPIRSITGSMIKEVFRLMFCSYVAGILTVPALYVVYLIMHVAAQH